MKGMHSFEQAVLWVGQSEVFVPGQNSPDVMTNCYTDQSRRQPPHASHRSHLISDVSPDRSPSKSHDCAAQVLGPDNGGHVHATLGSAEAADAIDGNHDMELQRAAVPQHKNGLMPVSMAPDQLVRLLQQQAGVLQNGFKSNASDTDHQQHTHAACGLTSAVGLSGCGPAHTSAAAGQV